MTDDRQEKAFLDAITASEELDSVTRLVFADWLEERGRDGEAQEQRRRATARWVEAHLYMKDLASRAGTHAPDYSNACAKLRKHRKEHGDDNPDSDTWREWTGERDVTVEDLINGGIEFMEEGQGYWSGFTQQGDEWLRDEWGRTIDPETFWEHWRAYTGREDRPDGEESPFSCSC